MIMDKNLKGLKPEAVWKHFAEICNIPHPSHEEDAIRAYIVKWAEEKGPFCHFYGDMLAESFGRSPTVSGIDVLQYGTGKSIYSLPAHFPACRGLFRRRRPHGDRSGGAVGDPGIPDRLFVF